MLNSEADFLSSDLTPTEWTPLSLDLLARFPSELYDCIIDHLHDDRRSLSACSLVCRDWHAASRYHLFQNAGTIRLDPRNYSGFAEVLSSQKNKLNGYIGRLALAIYIPRSPWIQLSERVQRRFTNDLQRLPDLPYLKYLSFYCFEFLPEVTNLVQNFPSVTQLELNRFRFDSFAEFLQVIAALPLLRRLAIIDTYLSDGQTLTPSVYSRSSELAEVLVSCCCPAPVLLPWLVSHRSIRRLSIRELSTVPHTGLLSAVLQALGPVLEDLIISDEGTARSTVLSDLSHSTGLRRLEITDIVCRGSDAGRLPTLLAQLKTPLLRHIVLVLDLPDRPHRMKWGLFDFPRVAELLAGMRSLQMVEILLKKHGRWAIAEIREKLQNGTYVLRVGKLEKSEDYSRKLSELKTNHIQTGDVKIGQHTAIPPSSEHT
ncbi:hypothetical protein B0H13DRAFT_1887841 [Mycena leptocephala]|nr:hypothetical protein B0H13DRAFT_1887841 [Mycena leptocephala]